MCMEAESVSLTSGVEGTRRLGCQHGHAFLASGAHWGIIHDDENDATLKATSRDLTSHTCTHSIHFRVLGFSFD